MSDLPQHLAEELEELGDVVPGDGSSGDTRHSALIELDALVRAGFLEDTIGKLAACHNIGLAGLFDMSTSPLELSETLDVFFQQLPNDPELLRIIGDGLIEQIRMHMAKKAEEIGQEVRQAADKQTA